MDNSSDTVLLGERLTTLSTNIETGYLLLAATIVFFMQAGFAFVEAGSVRSKNTINILFKNFLDTCVGCIAFWACGFAFSGSGNAFIGSKCFLLIGCEHDHLLIRSWFIQFVFSVTAATIVSGGMAERTEFASYLLYTAFSTAFLQPVVAHWVWSPDGWLKRGVDNNGASASFKDFAGSSAVHVVGGTAAFMGAAIVGPRLGRFDEAGQSVPIRGHTITLSALGVFILFFGFFAFNITALSNLMEEEADVTMGRIVVNTVMSGSTGALAALVVQRWVGRTEEKGWSLLTALNGSLSGLVAICAGADAVHPYGAFVTGLGSGTVYVVVHRAVLKARVDDPVNSVAVHWGGGCWGVLAVPFLDSSQGLFHKWNRSSLLLLGWNLCGLVVIMLWTATISGIVFGTLYGFNFLRVTKEVEIRGLDYFKHGEQAYTGDSHPVTSATNRPTPIREYLRMKTKSKVEKANSTTLVNKAAVMMDTDGIESSV